MNSDITPIPKNTEKAPHINLTGHLCGAFTAGQTSYVWVPTQQLRLTQVQVPGKRPAEWMAALPYALEETLCQAVEAVFVAVLHRIKTGEQAGLTFVALVDNAQMQTWGETLAANGLDNAQLVPDCFKLPYDASAPAAWMQANYDENGRPCRLLRTGVYEGMAGDPQWVEAYVTQYMAGYDGQPEDASPEIHSLAYETLPELSATEVKSFGIRQGEFQPENTQNGHAGWRAYRLGMMLVALIVFSLMAEAWVNTQRLEADTQQYQTQTKALFQKMFPDVKRIVNIKVQTNTALGQASEANQKKLGPAEISKKLEGILKPYRQISIEKWRWQRGRLLLNLKSTKSGDLQKIEQQVKAQFRSQLNIKQANGKIVSAELIVFGGSNVQ